jgi:hypothetical protein
MSELSSKLIRKGAALVRGANEKLFGIEFEQYHRLLRRVVVDETCQTLLDVGCGETSPIHKFSGEIPHTVGVDAHAPSVERSRARGIHTDYRVTDVLAIGSAFADGSFDCVVCLDVIEHFEKVDGNRLLDAMERIARKRVVVFTPNGFVPQPAEAGNPWQLHRSGWTAEEMRGRGYEVIGVGGWKPLRWSYALPKWRPRFFWERFARLTESHFESRPDRAFQILCVKKLGGSF